MRDLGPTTIGIEPLGQPGFQRGPAMQIEYHLRARCLRLHYVAPKVTPIWAKIVAGQQAVDCLAALGGISSIEERFHIRSRRQSAGQIECHAAEEIRIVEQRSSSPVFCRMLGHKHLVKPRRGQCSFAAALPAARFQYHRWGRGCRCLAGRYRRVSWCGRR